MGSSFGALSFYFLRNNSDHMNGNAISLSFASVYNLQMATRAHGFKFTQTLVV